MYPAIGINLRLDHLCAAQRRVPAAVGVAFRALHVRHQPAPLRRGLAKRVGRGLVTVGRLVTVRDALGETLPYAYHAYRTAAPDHGHRHVPAHR
jgi:hypothetical protein